MSKLIQWLAQPPRITVVHSHLRAPGKTPLYTVPNGWAVNLYDCTGWVNFPELDRSFSINRGDVSILPAGVNRQFDFTGSGRHRVVIFRFSDDEVDNSYPPSIMPGGSYYKRLEYIFDELLYYHSAGNSGRAQAVLWNLLWQVTDLQQELGSASSSHPALRVAVDFISNSLRSDLSAADVARKSGVSHNHLNRLFTENFGLSINRYIRDRRMNEAAALLVSTDIPVKEIAAESGIADLQKFNKSFRQHFGVSPRKYRQNIPPV